MVSRVDGAAPTSCTDDNEYRNCIVARRRVSYLEHSQVRLRVDLRRECLDVPCGTNETCVRGQCYLAEVDCEGTCDEETVAKAGPPVAPSTDGGVLDASVPLPDAGAEAGPVRPPPRSYAIAQIVAGWNHSCALFVDGRLFCWGDNRSGQVTGQAGPLPSPVTQVALGNATSFKLVAAGANSTCAITEGSEVRCWGGLGSGNGASPFQPGTVVPGPLAVGDDYACAVRSNGSVACWTSASGPGTAPTESGPVELASGGNGTRMCGLYAGATGGVTCWGKPGRLDAPGVNGTRGLAVTSTRVCALNGAEPTCSPSPPTIPANDSVAAIALSETAVHVALYEQGRVLALEGAVATDKPVAATKLAAGVGHVCAFSPADMVVKVGSVLCWGRNDYGQVTGAVSGDVVTPTTIAF